MQNSKRIVSVFILLALAFINASAQGQRQSSRSTNRQVGVILQRLDRSFNRFSNSLNTALAQQRIDQTRSGNDVNTFRSEFQRATVHLRDQFNQRRAVAADVENVLQNASRVNGFMGRNALNRRAQSDWAVVRTDLSSLATA
jgi:hypothetical protein